MATTDCTLTPVSAPNADATPRRTSLYVLAHDEPGFHLWDSPATPGSTGRSLCGIVTAWPDGGQYRTGRPKPRVADSPEGRRHLCQRCREAFDDDQYAEQVNKLADRLMRVARQLSDTRLAYAAQFAPTSIARHVARQVLGEREIVVHHQAHQVAGDFAAQTRALSLAVDALAMVPASPEVAALIDPVVTMGRQALGGGR